MKKVVQFEKLRQIGLKHQFFSLVVFLQKDKAVFTYFCKVLIPRLTSAVLSQIRAHDTQKKGTCNEKDPLINGQENPIKRKKALQALKRPHFK